MKASYNDKLLHGIFKTGDIHFEIRTNSENVLRMLSYESEKHESMCADSVECLFELLVLVMPGYFDFKTDNINCRVELDTFSPIALLSSETRKYLLIKDSTDFYSVRWAISTILAQSLETTKRIFSLHASCIFLDEIGGIAFVGNKNAGKSSLMATFLARYNAQFVSDDTTMIKCGDDSISCFGFFGGLNLVSENKNRIRRKVFDINDSYTTQKNRFIVNKEKRLFMSKVDFLVFPNWNESNNKCELLPVQINGRELQKNMVFDFNNNYAELYQMVLNSNVMAFKFNMSSEYDKNCQFLINSLKQLRGAKQ